MPQLIISELSPQYIELIGIAGDISRIPRPAMCHDYHCPYGTHDTYKQSLVLLTLFYTFVVRGSGYAVIVI